MEKVVPFCPVEVTEGVCCSNKRRQDHYNCKNEIPENFLKPHDEEEEAAMGNASSVYGRNTDVF